MPTLTRNAIAYRLPAGSPPANLAEQLARAAFRPCGALDLASQGFVPPREGVKPQVHASIISLREAA